MRVTQNVDGSTGRIQVMQQDYSIDDALELHKMTSALGCSVLTCTRVGLVPERVTWISVRTTMIN